MGFEYRATFADPPDRSELDATLRSRPTFSRFDPAFASYQFRLPSNTGAMPNLEVRFVLDEAGRVRELYVCDYGRDGTILHDLESSVRVTLEELE